MIDIETLDIRPSAVVFQVGLLAFNDPLFGDDGKVLEEKLLHLDILPQILRGRTIDSSTVQFWKEQEVSSWARGPQEIVTTGTVFSEIARMMGEHGVGDVWSNSPSFDAVIMRSLAESMGPEIFQFPTFRDDMDMRTLKRLMQRLGLMKDAPTSETTHHALQDCRDQKNTVVFMLQGLYDLKRKSDMLEAMDKGPI
jgi:hypothetical protein